MSLLDALFRNGHLRTLDHALAQSLRRLDPATPDAVLAAAALASLAVAKGHAGVRLDRARELLDHDDPDLDWPSADAWQQRLAASRWVASPDDAMQAAASDAPLVLETGLLYLRRYREYERNLALGLRRIASHVPRREGIEAIAPLFARLFPHALIPTLLPQAGEGLDHAAAASADKTLLPPAGEGLDHAAAASPDTVLLPPAGEGARRADEGVSSNPAPRPDPPTPAREGAEPDRQARAAALALRHALLLVTGGPGTGKTTTVARLLVLLAAQAAHADAPPPRIALAAPTGRAAERMAESVRRALRALAAQGIDAALLDPLPTTGTTLHRLLGTLPDSPRFRHHADHPLPFDVVLVDEASMIDLPLMAKLVDAVADGARLVLLGDPDQLPSVEAGDVLAAILQAAGDGLHLADSDAEALSPLLGTRTTGPAGDRDPHTRHPGEGRHPGASALASATSVEPRHAGFPGRRIHLTRGYRQSESLQLAPLAAAVRVGDAHGALARLRDGTLSNVHFHEGLADPLQAHRDALLPHWRSLAEAATPVEALARAGQLRLLTAVREGPQGARGLNARIEALLSEGGHAARRPASARHFHGQPILVTENSYRHRLFNGDIGIVHRDDAGALMAWFPGDDPAHPRAFHPAALPAHDSAFAMTVHKAQGSEFDTVWLLLPARPNRVLSRELLYTGITRARRELHLAASEPILRDALSRHASRWSGLGGRLGPAGDAPRRSSI